MKTDIDIQPILDVAARSNLKEQIGFADQFVLVGSSTWPGEEQMLVEAFRNIRAKLPNSGLLIVPRHGERRDEIRNTLKRTATDFSVHFRSEGKGPSASDILVADTHGELRMFTQIADLAFIGKSLPPHMEGQTPIECGLLGVPAVMGPGMQNFPGVADQLVDCGAAARVRGREEAIEILGDLAVDDDFRLQMETACRDWASANKGATRRTLAEIEGVLG